MGPCTPMKTTKKGYIFKEEAESVKKYRNFKKMQNILFMPWIIVQIILWCISKFIMWILQFFSHRSIFVRYRYYQNNLYHNIHFKKFLTNIFLYPKLNNVIYFYMINLF